MQFLKVIVTTSVTLGLLGVLIHQLSPEYMTLLSLPIFKTVTLKLQSIISGVGLDLLSKSETVLSVPPNKQKIRKETLFTGAELKNFDGRPGSKGLYLAILGLVFNVKKGKKHYGPGGGYEFFAGCDASRAFVSGDFSEVGLTDDITDLTPADYIGLDDWIKFYQKDYKYIGKLIGRYYDQMGEPTSYYYEVQKWIAQAYQQREDENHEKKMFPPCNSEWTPESGSRIWCTPHSGGVDREWTGVPRKLYTPGQSKPRCACIKANGPPSYDLQRKTHDDRGDLDNPNLEEYPGCHPEETYCHLIDN